MANQHTTALIARATELAAEVAALIRQETDLLIIVNDPQCGKPGRGYKAARKARRTLRELESGKPTWDVRYHAYLTDGKASAKTRQQRADAFTAALHEALL